MFEDIAPEMATPPDRSKAYLLCNGRMALQPPDNANALLFSGNQTKSAKESGGIVTELQSMQIASPGLGRTAHRMSSAEASVSYKTT